MPLGTTGIKVSRLAFGAGPVAAVMTGEDAHAQRALVQRVLEAGINWIDTAAGYGNGSAERAVGRALAALGAQDRIHVATKVRLQDHQLDDIPSAVHASATASLERLGLRRLTLLQLHNSITVRRGDEPDSITPRDVLGKRGVVEALEQLRREGITQLLGITAIGQAGALAEVIDSGRFDTIQIPYNLVNPSAGQDVPTDFNEANYGNAIGRAARRRMGVFAIRVYAGGVLAGQSPSQHTLKTKYFPLDLFERDQARALRLQEMTNGEMEVKELALRFALSHSAVSSAIVGFAEPRHIDEAAAYLREGPLLESLVEMLRAFNYR